MREEAVRTLPSQPVMQRLVLASVVLLMPGGLLAQVPPGPYSPAIAQPPAQPPAVSLHLVQQPSGSPSGLQPGRLPAAPTYPPQGFPPGALNSTPPTSAESSAPDEPLPAAPAPGLEETKDETKYPTATLTGMFQLDTAAFHQDQTNLDTLGDLEDGTVFRRVRFGATGKVAEDVGFTFEFDLAQAAPRFADVWMQFDDAIWQGDLRVGRFRQPFGMTELTSIRSLPFLERPLPFALTPFRQTGVMFAAPIADQGGTVGVSGYRYLSDNFGNVFGDSGGWGTAGRITSLLVDGGDGALLHLGAGYSWNDPARNLVQLANTNEVFLGQNPELGPAGIDALPIVNLPPFVNTGPMPTEQMQLFNVEAAAAWGSLIVQSEARWAVVDLTTGERNVFPGWYVHLRYVLTGETVAYSRENGVFGGLTPACPVGRGGWGAWEVATRLSHLDLNGDGLPGPGRRLTDLTGGVNWYLNQYVKFQFNYIHSFLDDPQLGDSHVDTVALRGQLEF